MGTTLTSAGDTRYVRDGIAMGSTEGGDMGLFGMKPADELAVVFELPSLIIGFVCPDI